MTDSKENENLLNEISNKNLKIDQFCNEIAIYQTKNSRLLKIIEDFEKKFESNNFEKENLKLRRILENKLSEYDSLLNNFSILEKKYQELEKSNEKYKNINDDLMIEIEKLKIELNIKSEKNNINEKIEEENFQPKNKDEKTKKAGRNIKDIENYNNNNKNLEELQIKLAHIGTFLYVLIVNFFFFFK